MSARTAIECFFAPRTVALIGATDHEGSVGRTVLVNLRNRKFPGTVYAVNPNRSTVMGLPCCASVAAVPEKIDLAVVVTPARTVPAVIRECVDAGVRSAIVISAGFKERGPEGAKLEQQIQAELRRGTMRLLGPNCLGMMNPEFRTQRDIRGGNRASRECGISQPKRRALNGNSRLEFPGGGRIQRDRFHGFDAGHGLGGLDFLFRRRPPNAQHPSLHGIHRRCARLSFRGAGSGAQQAHHRHQSRSFGSGIACCQFTHRRANGQRRSVRCGFSALWRLTCPEYFGLVLHGRGSRQAASSAGPRLTILTNAGGPGVLATDALIATGGELAPLSKETMDALDEFLPRIGVTTIRLIFSATLIPSDTTALSRSPSKIRNSDGLLVILAPQGMTNPAEVAERLKPYSRSTRKPVLASWMGGKHVAEGEAILNAAGIPTFAYPDTAARAFNYMWRYSYNIRGLYETPTAADEPQAGEPTRCKVEAILERVLSSGRTLLTEIESKQLLALYQIPTVRTSLAHSEQEAASLAEGMGFPVVLKVHSETVTHKTDVGGVELNLENAETVRQAFRAIQSSVTQ